MAYGGQEIFNGPRTKAYLEHLQPSLTLGDMCCECDSLGEALGDGEYNTPAQDEAAWFNPYAAETGGFYGLIPLSVQGFDDSTWETPLTDLMGHGSVSGRGRRGGRDLRFRMLAVAESEKAMSRGLSWLTDALGGEGCATGDCGGAQMCYLTDCPGCCPADAPEAVEQIDHLDYRGMTPAAVEAAALTDWTSSVIPVAYTRTSGQVYALWSGSGVSVERTLTGFVPGAAYRIALDFGSVTGPGVTEIRVSIPGAAELLPPRTSSITFTASAAPHPEQGVAVWEFIATECEHRVVIESTQDLAIGMMDVAVTALGTLPYTGQPGYYADDSTSWSPNPAIYTSGTFTVLGPSPGLWTFSAVTGSASLPVGAGEVRAVITGLRIGAAYRVTFGTTMDLGSAATPGTTVVYDSEGTVLDREDPATDPLPGGSHGNWVTLEFVAPQTQVYLGLANKNAVTVSAAAPLKVGVRSVTVEELDPLPEWPDPNDDLRRFLRDVVLTSGPTVTKVYPSYTAVMKEIQWTMHANVPDPLGVDVVVTRSLGSGRWMVPEVACSLGEEVRVNWIPNPSGEYGVLGWPVPAGSTVTNPASATAKSGTKVIRLTQTTANTVNRTATLIAGQPVVAGESWVFTLPVRSSLPGRRVRGLVTWMNGALVTGTAHAYLDTSDSLTAWQVIVAGGAAPPSTTSATFALQVDAPAGGFVANEYVEFDAVMLEQAYSQRAFFDGDSPSSTWDSTPGNSPSEYARVTAALVFDPDCPPTPEPPRPPDIVNICLTTPESWIRYVLDIPALATAKSPRSAPTVTVQTGATAARGVRVRLYANPFSRSFKDLDPCAYCGEFLISYLPPYATVTVDAADQTATVVTSQGSQSALSLLFGSDGGPVTWPSLGCAMPYLMTLDLDAAEAPLIAASLSVTPIF